MIVRKFMWIATAGILVTLLAACGQSESPNSGEQSPAEKALEPEEDLDLNRLRQDSEESPDDAASATDESGFSFRAKGKDGSVEIAAGENSFEIKSGSGASMTVGGNAKLPDDMASDIPTHDDMELMSVTNAPEKNALMYQAKIKEPVSDVAAYYSGQAEAEGWEENMNMNQSSQLAMRQYMKDDRILNITINKTEDGSVVTVTTAAK